MDNKSFYTIISVVIGCTIGIVITLILTQPSSIKMPDNNIVIINETSKKDTLPPKIIKIPVKSKGKRYCKHLDDMKHDTTVLVIDSASVVRIRY